MASVLLIRHCQTTGQSADSPLTELGREQAVAVAAWLAGRGVDRIVTSSYQRAIETILPFASQWGLKVETDVWLAERRLGGGWFATPQEMFDAVRAAMADYDLRHDGGETGHEVVERGWLALAEALDGSNTVTAVVAHGQINSHLLGNIEPSFGYDGWLAMTTPDVVAIWRDADGVHFKRLWQGT